MPDSTIFFGGCVTLFFACVVCAAGGVGGGGIVVPILLIIYDYNYQSCVNYSLFTLLGSYFAQLTINLYRFHPTKKFHPLIAWEVVTVLLPAQLGGSNIGSILAGVFPDSVRYIFALVFLCYACYLTYTKGVHRWEDESREMEEQRKLEEAKSEIEAPRNSTIDEIGSTVSEADIQQMILPRKSIIVIAVMWLSYIAIIVGMNFTKKCSTAFDVSMVILYIPLLITIVWGVGVLRGQEKRTSNTNSLMTPKEYVDNPMASTNHNTIATTSTTITADEAPPGDTIATKDILPFPVIVFVIGIICSLLGIGGGELLSPLLLSYHMIPQIVSATSATMSFLNTLANIIRLMTAHSGTIDAGFIFTCVGFLGGIVGRQLGLYIATHNGRASVIIFALVIVLFFSCLYYLVVLATGDFDAGMKVYC